MNKRKELFGEFAYNVFNAESDYNAKVLESKNVNHLENYQLDKNLFTNIYS